MNSFEIAARSFVMILLYCTLRKLCQAVFSFQLQYAYGLFFNPVYLAFTNWYDTRDK